MLKMNGETSSQGLAVVGAGHHRAILLTNRQPATNIYVPLVGSSPTLSSKITRLNPLCNKKALLRDETRQKCPNFIVKFSAGPNSLSVSSRESLLHPKMASNLTDFCPISIPSGLFLGLL